MYKSTITVYGGGEPKSIKSIFKKIQNAKRLKKYMSKKMSCIADVMATELKRT